MKIINNKYLALFFYLIIIFYLLNSNIIYEYFVPQDLSKYIGLFRDWVITLNDTYCEIKKENNECRPYQYGPILLYIPFPDLLKDFYYKIFPYLSVGIFILFIFIIFDRYYDKNKLLILVLIFSPTTLLVLERGNLDLHLFLLAIIICYNKYYYINLILVSVSFLLKYYPVTYFFNIFTYYDKRSVLSLWVSLLFCLIFCGAFLFFYKDIFMDLFSNLSASKAGYHMIFSMKTLAKIFKYYFSFNYILLLFIFYTLFIFIVYKFVSFNLDKNIDKEIDLKSVEEKLFLIGTNTSLFTYAVFSNIYYREIFLILSIPMLLKLREKSKLNNIFSFVIFFITARYLFLHFHNFTLLNDNHYHINDERVFHSSFLLTLLVKSIFDYLLIALLTSLVFFQNIKIFKILFKKH